jgi:hypothetical protein
MGLYHLCKQAQKSKIKGRARNSLQSFGLLSIGLAETPITADKREIKDFPKLRACATSFIRQLLLRNRTTAG